ncbi:transposase family protein [Rhizobium sp. R693]|uniref:transposase family protein n=1 Tax=Rhizobium sp. R693 TaxID=1764276 RepID=UPI0011325CCC|nr:transposase family protein [Rhizobium sp. R693]
MAASNSPSAGPLDAGRKSVWCIGVYRLALWVKGIQPVSYCVLDEVTRTVLAGVTVKSKSTETVIGLLENALALTGAPSWIITSDMDLIGDASFQDWVSRQGIKVSYPLHSAVPLKSAP